MLFRASFVFLVLPSLLTAPRDAPQKATPPAQTPVVQPQDVIKKVLTLIGEFGQDEELSGGLSQALEFSQDQNSWPYRQLTGFNDEANASGPLHVIGSHRGSDPGLLLFTFGSGIRYWIHIQPDGTAVAAVSLDTSNKWTKMSPAEAQSAANSEIRFWDNNGEPAAHWSDCQAQLGGAHAVTRERKIAGCTWLINSRHETTRGLATAYANRGTAYGFDDQAKGLADLQQAVKVDPSFVVGWAELCSAQNWIAKDSQSAIQSCSKALEVDPKSSQAWTYRGDIYLRAKEYDKAIADYSHAIEFSSGQWMWPLDNRGEAYLRKGDLDLALADFNSVIRVSSDWAMGYLDRGILHLREKAYGDALSDFKTGIKVDPKCGTCYIGMGLAKRAQGDTAGGDADIAKGKQISPKGAEGFEEDGITVP